MKTNQTKHKLTDHDFGKLSKTESNPRARTRLYILHQYSLKKTGVEIAKNVSVCHHTALRTKSRYLKHGLPSIYDAHRKGRNSKLASEHIDSLKKRIIQEQEDREGGRVIGEDIKKILREEYNADYSLNGVYELMKRIDMSWMNEEIATIKYGRPKCKTKL